MAALSAFFTLMAPRLPGAAEISIEAAARRATIEFCQKTLVLQRTLPEAYLFGGTNPANCYVLRYDGEVMARLLGAKLDGRPLTLLTKEEADEAILTTTPGQPSHIMRTGPMRVEVYPPPAASGGSLVVRAAMRPSQDAIEIDDDLFEEFGHVIAHGAVAELAGQAEKSYTNPNVAADAEARFREEIALAKERAFLNGARTKRTRRMQWF